MNLMWEFQCAGVAVLSQLFIISFFAEIVPTDGCSFASAAELLLRKLRGLWEVISGEKQVDWGC